MTRMVVVLIAASLLSRAATAGEERFRLRLSSGTEVQVRLMRPSESAVRLPAIVVLGGLQRGCGVVDLIPHTTNAVLVGFDYPVALPERVSWTDVLPIARRLERGIHETIEAVARLQALLMRRPDVDAARLSIVGVSFGAPFAVIGAAQEGYRGVVIIDGFGDLPYTLRHQFARRWRARYGVLGDALAWLAETAALQLVDVPDLEAAARSLRATQSVYVIDAEVDEFLPERSRRALHEALRRSSAELTIETMPGGHVRAADEQKISRLYAHATDWMRRQGLLN